LTYFLNSRTGRSQVQGRAQGTTRLRVNVGNLKTIEVPVPSITEQNRIVSRLRQIESTSDAVAERIVIGAATLTTLTNSLLGQP
jgi:type I restriction enzyme S subunit